MKTAPFTQFSVATLGTIADRFIAIAQLNANTAVVASPLFTVLKESYAAFEPLLKKQSFSGMGARVAELDLQRDRNFSAVKRLLSGFSNYETTRGEAARALLEHFDLVSEAIHVSYTEEDALLDKLEALLSTEQAQKQIVAVGIAEEINLLFDLHHAFKAACLDQADANSDLRQQTSATALRRDLEDALRAFYLFVIAMKKVAPWKDIHADLTEVVKSARATLRKKTAAQPDEDEQTDVEQP